MIYEVKFVSHSLLWTGAGKNKQTKKTLWGSLFCLLGGERATQHLTFLLNTTVQHELNLQHRLILSSLSSAVSFLAAHPAPRSPYQRPAWFELTGNERCSQTASWPPLIVATTRAATDIAAHLFPAAPVSHLENSSFDLKLESWQSCCIHGSWSCFDTCQLN